MAKRHNDMPKRRIRRDHDPIATGNPSPLDPETAEWIEKNLDTMTIAEFGEAMAESCGKLIAEFPHTTHDLLKGCFIWAMLKARNKPVNEEPITDAVVAKAVLSNFSSRLAEMKNEAGRYGLWKTMHAFDRPTSTTEDGEPAGPLYTAGFEIAEILKRHGN